ncbi:hypothetical protein [Fluviicola sp.]|uniref:hypothetical protein n=1 Tax=Fluviicola sp. TaxID=1917219 RepID=UPI003D2DCA5A
MSSTTTTNSLALHEIVLSIADSLNEAQETLRNVSPYDEYGRPNTLYQLPYLDFNLEVISQFETSQTGSSTGGNGIRFIPFRSTETTTKNQGVITSNISGRFVAVMPNDGLPQIALSAITKFNETNSEYAIYSIAVKAVQPNNEFVIGQRIEINFDEATSTDLNSKISVSAPVFIGAKDGYTRADDGNVYVQVKLKIADYNAGRTFVFKANSGTQFISIAISKP